MKGLCKEQVWYAAPERKERRISVEGRRSSRTWLCVVSSEPHTVRSCSVEPQQEKMVSNSAVQKLNGGTESSTPQGWGPHFPLRDFRKASNRNQQNELKGAETLGGLHGSHVVLWRPLVALSAPPAPCLPYCRALHLQLPFPETMILGICDSRLDMYACS